LHIGGEPEPPRGSEIIENLCANLVVEAKTGIVGILKNGPGPTVMYRADMDANAVQEQTGLPYESKVRVQRADGTETYVAHMCGHDVAINFAKRFSILHCGLQVSVPCVP
jgi:metal-dependent amidase/aminoacylase/carboxypeptidase family protein